MSETLDIGAVFLPKEMVGKRVIVMEVNAERLADEIGLLVRPMTLSRGHYDRYPADYQPECFPPGR